MAAASDNKSIARIFVSYRREDSTGYIISLSQTLRDRFRHVDVFVDIDRIKPGENFVDRIQDAVRSSGVLLAVIGKEWLLTSANGMRRLDDPKDFVRLELTTALKNKIPVIPVLVNDAKMPTQQDLPLDLISFTHQHALELSNTRWVYDMDQLIARLREIPSLNVEAKKNGSNRTTKVFSLLMALLIMIAMGGWYAYYTWNGSRGEQLSTKRTSIAFQTITNIAVPVQPYKVGLNSSGTIVALVGAMNEVQLWRVQNGQPLKTLSGQNGYGRSIAFNPTNDQVIASGSDDRSIRLWKVDEPKPFQTLQTPDGYVFSLIFSKNGEFITTASRDASTDSKMLKVLAKDGTTLYQHQIDAAETIAAISANAPMAAVHSPSGLRLQPLNGKEAISRTISSDKFEITTGAFSDSGQFLFIGIRSDGGGLIRGWDLKDGRLAFEKPIVGSHISSLAVSPDDRFIVCGTNDGKVHAYAVGTGHLEAPAQSHSGAVTNLAFSNNGNVFASVGMDKRIVLSQVTIK